MTVLPAEASATRPDLFRPRPERTSRQLRLAALPTAAACARHLVAGQLRRWRLDRLVGDAELVISELVTNAVKATGTLQMPRSYTELHDLDLATVALRLRLASASLFLEVWDADPNPAVHADADALDEGGRGLTLVAALAKAWDHYPSDADGKVVWAELDVAAAREAQP